MVTQQLPADTPALALFPPFREFYEALYQEVAGLNDAQLDFTSTRWGWAEWSIRKQVSHLAAMHLRWEVTWFGTFLFPNGTPLPVDFAELLDNPSHRWLSETRYRPLPALLDKVGVGLDLLETGIQGRTVGDLRRMEIRRELSLEYWPLMLKAHPDGFTQDAANPRQWVINFEAIIRHMYYEDTTHLYNIQRLKRAQGLAAVSAVPPVGYWVLDGWDRSEP